MNVIRSSFLPIAFLSVTPRDIEAASFAASVGVLAYTNEPPLLPSSSATAAKRASGLAKPMSQTMVPIDTAPLVERSLNSS
ncbi:hypothetical protein D3C76_1149790 [compost metagenome]